MDFEKNVADEKYEPISWDSDNNLIIEESKIVDLVEQYGTPITFVSERQLRNNARVYKSCFEKNWPEGQVRIMPAIKANITTALRQILTEEKCGCDVFSYTELHIALSTGIEPYMISFNGNGKLIGENEKLKEVIEKGVRLTIDLPDEFEVIENICKELDMRANIRLRVRPEFPDIKGPSEFKAEKTPVELTMNAYKQGIPTNNLVEICKKALESPYINLTGVHMHLGRNRKDVDTWAGAMKGFADIIGVLKKECNGWEPLELDIGGGIPSRRDPNLKKLYNSFAPVGYSDVYERIQKTIEDNDPNLRFEIYERYLNEVRNLYGKMYVKNPLEIVRPPIEKYAEVITQALREGLEANHISTEGKILEIEPGRSMYGDIGIHVTKVTSLKEQTEPYLRRWVNCDTAENFLLNTELQGAIYPYIFNGYPRIEVDQKNFMFADIVGNSCNTDRLVVEALVPKTVKKDDIIIFVDTTAYNEGLACNFNGLPRPGTVLVNGDKSKLIKKGESMEDVLSRDIILDM